MSEPQATLPPVTGNATVDQALAEVVDLSEMELAEHHARLSAVQDVLTGVLESSRHVVPTSIPDALRPRTQEQHG